MINYPFSRIDIVKASRRQLRRRCIRCSLKCRHTVLIAAASANKILELHSSSGRIFLGFGRFCDWLTLSGKLPPLQGLCPAACRAAYMAKTVLGHAAKLTHSLRHKVTANLARPGTLKAKRAGGLTKRGVRPSLLIPTAAACMRSVEPLLPIIIANFENQLYSQI